MIETAQIVTGCSQGRSQNHPAINLPTVELIPEYNTIIAVIIQQIDCQLRSFFKLKLLLEL